MSRLESRLAVARDRYRRVRRHHVGIRGRLSALEAGATDILLSPVDHHEFLTRARNLLRLRRQQ